MRWKVLLVVLLGLACWVAGQCWTLWIQPELTTEVALTQMDRSEQAPHLMRSVAEAGQWSTVVLWSLFLLGTVLILAWDLPRQWTGQLLTPQRKEMLR